MRPSPRTKLVMTGLLLVVFAALTHCGSSSSTVTPTPTPSTTYTIGGTLSGLSGTVVLQNNAANDLSLTADGSFTFTTALADAEAYAVTVLTQPSGQTCTVSSGSGTIAAANVTGVTVTCVTSSVSTTYTVGGTLSGLSGTVVLQNNAANDLSLTADGSFTFTTALADAATYAVTVLTQPSGQTCTVTGGSGTIAAANVSNITVTCASPTVPTVSLSGTLLSSGNSTTIATSGTTGISGATAAPLTMTYSTAMSNSTVTSGATFQCPSGTTLTPTLATSDNTIYTITPTSALPQMSSCVLSLPTTITNSSGTALAATSYTYTTGCGTNDDFSNSSTLASCWTASDASAATISIASNVLNMSLSTDPGFMAASEYKSFASGDITVTVAIPTFSGINPGSNVCGLEITDPSSAFNGIMLLVSNDGGNIKLNSALVDGSNDVLSGSLGAGTSSAALADTLYIRISLSGTSVTQSYRVGASGGFTTIDSKTLTIGSKRVNLAVDSAGSSTTNCQYSNFTVTGATATGQYAN